MVSHPLNQFLGAAEPDLQIGPLLRPGLPDPRESLQGVQPGGKAFQHRQIFRGGIAVYLVEDRLSPFLQEAGVAAVGKLRIQADLVKIQDHILHSQTGNIQFGMQGCRLRGRLRFRGDHHRRLGFRGDHHRRLRLCRKLGFPGFPLPRPFQNVIEQGFHFTAGHT